MSGKVTDHGVRQPRITPVPSFVKKNDARGFTLIELMVVLVILGVLASLIVPRIMSRPEEARRIKARVDIQSLETALKLYNLDSGDYPTTEQGLQALIDPPATGMLPTKWRDGGYLEKRKLPKDPWGNDYIYLSPGTQGDFDLISYGADGELGGEGKDVDIVNWELE
jgi:general secretion pathway protein G